MSARYSLFSAALATSFFAGAVQAAPPAVPQVPVVTLGAQAVSPAFTLDGSLQAVRQSTLSAQASGRIVSLSVKAGDPVKAGQLLAVIDDRVTQAGMAQANAGAAQASAQLSNAQASFDRTRDLRAQGFVAQAALDTAQAQLKAAQAGLAAAKAGQTQSGLAQGFTRLTAPFDGWVQQTLVEAGSLAMPGAPILVVYAPLPLRAVVFVPASQQALAQQATGIEIELPGSGRWVAPLATRRVPAADPVSQTVEWRLELRPADAAGQTPGQQLRVRFSGAPVAAATAQRLLLPASAVLRRGELTAVYVVSAKTDNQAPGFVLRSVRTGATQAAGIEILAGLKAGEQVALDPVRAGLLGAVVAP
jgi:RND family efflux transporter MFP subunit